MCTQAPSHGGCSANFLRWYFNVHVASCSWFTYGGCGGNENNFRTREECETTCITSKHKDDSLKDGKFDVHSFGDKDSEGKVTLWNTTVTHTGISKTEKQNDEFEGNGDDDTGWTTKSHYAPSREYAQSREGQNFVEIESAVSETQHEQDTHDDVKNRYHHDLDNLRTKSNNRLQSDNERLASVALKAPSLPTTKIQVGTGLRQTGTLIQTRMPRILQAPARESETSDVRSGMLASESGLKTSYYAAMANETVRQFPLSKQSTKRKRKERKRKQNFKRGRQNNKYGPSDHSAGYFHGLPTINSIGGDSDVRPEKSTLVEKDSNFYLPPSNNRLAEHRQSETSIVPSKTQSDQAKKRWLMDSADIQQKLRKNNKKTRKHRHNKGRIQGKERERNETTSGPISDYYEKIDLFGLLQLADTKK